MGLDGERKRGGDERAGRNAREGDQGLAQSWGAAVVRRFGFELNFRGYSSGGGAGPNKRGILRFDDAQTFGRSGCVRIADVRKQKVFEMEATRWLAASG